MKKCFFGAIAVLALASCSNEKVVELSQDQEIKLTVEAGKATSRAADGYCPANLPPSFQVWAKQETKNYFEGETFKKNDAGTAWEINSTDKRYWPESGNLQMFAALNYEGANSSTVTWDATNTTTPAQVKDFVVPNAVNAQKDFIYAVNAATSKADNKLNFRHGLAEVVFRAQNLNPNIYVEVTGVKVMNVQNKGTFTFPIASTSDNVKDESNPQNGASFEGKTQGSWDVTTTSLDSYTVTLPSAVEVSQAATNTTPVSLTYDFKSQTERYNANSLYLMEQKETKVWNGTDALKKAGEGEGAQKVYDTECGAYLILTCSIWNVAAGNGSVKADTDVALWTNKDIAVKLPSLAWKHGYKYVYTFKFTENGNGGTDPDTDEPVFTPIELTVDVDDFVNETETPVDMVDLP